MKKLLFVLIPALLICGCSQTQGDTSQVAPSVTSEITSSAQDSNTKTGKTTATTSTKSGTSTTKTTQSTTKSVDPTTKTESTSTGKPGSNPYTHMSTASGDDYMSGRPILPIGNVQLDAPTNTPIQIKTSTSADDWLTYKFTDQFPSNDWTYIYGNSSSKGPSGHYAGTGSAFYSYQSGNEKQYPGGLKLAQKYVGFQTPMFYHSGEKLEIRIPISQVNNSSGTPEKGKDIGYLYFYDTAGNFIPNLTVNIAEGSIETKTTQLKYYITGQHVEVVGYVEMRLNVQPYKSSQCYNVGIGGFQIHSWTYA